MTNPNRLAETIQALEAELAETEARVAKLRQAISAIRDLVPHHHYDRDVVEAATTIDVPATGPVPATPAPGPRPPLKKAILTVLGERTWGEEWTLTDLVWTLAQRGWLGGKDGKPSRESARAVLLAMRRDGEVERTETGWRLPAHSQPEVAVS